ncbi:MAG TPA: dihydrodipicolinate synthase family protein [Verrucomicrobiae bacterium]|nr:dihydrodipicolinate synthase family protein [Verrucomicrobiae bacterium]
MNESSARVPTEASPRAAIGASAATPLSGIIPPMITPLSGRDTLDVAGLERLIEHIIAGGVNGLFILGTSGEAPGLSYRLRRELVERTCRQVRGRLPVLVGITDTSFVEALAMAALAAESGAQAVVSAGPFYLPTAQPELVDYVERLVRELPLPLYLYNMPQLTKVPFEIETLRHLAGLKQIAGVKDSSGDLAYFERLLALKRERPDWSMLVGPEHLLAEATRRGGDGGVNGGANYHPRLFVDLFAAVKREDRARVEQLQDQILQLGQIYSVGRHASAVIKGMKCACSLLGLCDDHMAEPFERFHEPERARVRAVLASLHLLPAP